MLLAIVVVYNDMYGTAIVNNCLLWGVINGRATLDCSECGQVYQVEVDR